MGIRYDDKNKIKNELEQKYKEKIQSLEAKIVFKDQEIQHLKDRVADSKERNMESKKLEDKNKFLNHSNKVLKRHTKGQNSYDVLPEKDKKLISKINNLTFSITQYTQLTYKFQRGTDDIIPLLIMTHNNEKLTIHDLATYTFRDNLLSLLEKIMQSLTKKHGSKLIKTLNYLKASKANLKEAVGNKKSIEKTLTNDTIGHFILLYQIENTAFHGCCDTLKIQNINIEQRNSLINSQRASLAFLTHTPEEQYGIFIELLEFIYEIFSLKENELVLLDIINCWNVPLNI